MTRQSFSATQAAIFRAHILAWFDIHKRDLPWRRTRDPYAIWVSEIMLQQTRVAAVLDHYANWMLRFPTVEALAEAPQDQVLTAWSGLGYYRRARSLHKGAKAVVADRNGQLPQTAAELRKLPGIGPYTSAAIASIAFGEATAVVDGNVERVLLRQTGHAETGAAGPGDNPGPTLNPAAIQEIAGRLIDPSRPGDFNQAIMELGATICLPRNPLCLQCPVQKSCCTRGEHQTLPRKPSINADIAYALIQRESKASAEVMIERRSPQSTVMADMWELPRLDTDPLPGKPLLVLRHAIMQTNYRVTVVGIPPETSAAQLADPANQSWVELPNLPALPLTGLARKIFQRLGMLPRP